MIPKEKSFLGAIKSPSFAQACLIKMAALWRHSFLRRANKVPQILLVHENEKKEKKIIWMSTITVLCLKTQILYALGT